MTEINQIYKCNVCGNIVEMLHDGIGELVCCKKPMELKKEQSEGEYAEKHAPVIEKTEKGYKVKIGSVPHPMEEKHYIEWIELIGDTKVYREFLNPEDKPEAEFCTDSEKVKARMHCNIHGLWISKS